MDYAIPLNPLEPGFVPLFLWSYRAAKSLLSLERWTRNSLSALRMSLGDMASRCFTTLRFTAKQKVFSFPSTVLKRCVMMCVSKSTAPRKNVQRSNKAAYPAHPSSLGKLSHVPGMSISFHKWPRQNPSLLNPPRVVMTLMHWATKHSTRTATMVTPVKSEMKSATEHFGTSRIAHELPTNFWLESLDGTWRQCFLGLNPIQALSQVSAKCPRPCLDKQGKQWKTRG